MPPKLPTFDMAISDAEVREITHNGWAVKLSPDFVCPSMKSQLPKVSARPFFAKLDLSPATKEEKRLFKKQPREALETALREQVIVSTDMHIFLDRDRQVALADAAEIIGALDAGKLRGNAFGRMWIGPKGVGKSSFLQALIIASQHLTKHTICIWADAAKDKTIKLKPAGVIAECLKGMLPVDFYKHLHDRLDILAAANDVDKVLDITLALGLRILLAVDEYATIYSLPEAVGDEWRSQVYAIGNDDKGRIALLLSGSAPYMRSFCFGEAPLNPEFPSYKGKSGSINSNRFQTVSLGPIPFDECIVKWAKKELLSLYAPGIDKEKEAGSDAAGDVSADVEEHWDASDSDDFTMYDDEGSESSSENEEDDA